MSRYTLSVNFDNIEELKQTMEQLETLGRSTIVTTPPALSNPAPKMTTSLPDDPDDPDALSDPVEVTRSLEDIKELATEVIGQAKSKEFRALLNEYDAKTIKDLKPEDYGKFYDATEELSNG